MSSDDVTTALVRALIENMKGAAEGWKSFAMVIDFDGDRFSGTHGYAYSPDGAASAVASRPSAVRDAVNAYMDSYYEPGQPRPVAVLVQFDRDNGKYEVTFEDEDASRWQVTPSNIDAVRDAIKPAF
ncbi:hypothetical protein [Microbacterium sp.]|jgi:hypothetical protein|uniref:hypothetical protein n=1 Tax=Microbacterium sp. TaxID=51671 RepID=UPI000C0837AB|nr:hypothetical protein [Microbacterium sp.]PYD02352.1 hypothetical protein B4U78_001350 [Microbacterium esteraromaticum]